MIVAPRPLRAVLFDWDGTLADTAEASFRCYVRMFADLGISFDREAYRRTYSPDWYHTFRCVGLPEESWADADERWLRYFAEETVALIDGARDAIEALGRHGVTRAIVTSGSRPRVERELVAHGLREHFRDVVCGTDTVIIRELQTPGKKRLSAKDLANGRGIAIGDLLGKPEIA